VLWTLCINDYWWSSAKCLVGYSFPSPSAGFVRCNSKCFRTLYKQVFRNNVWKILLLIMSQSYRHNLTDVIYVVQKCCHSCVCILTVFRNKSGKLCFFYAIFYRGRILHLYLLEFTWCFETHGTVLCWFCQNLHSFILWFSVFLYIVVFNYSFSYICFSCVFGFQNWQLQMICVFFMYKYNITPKTDNIIYRANVG
jgi:hypothetical protein